MRSAVVCYSILALVWPAVLRASVNGGAIHVTPPASMLVTCILEPTSDGEYDGPCEILGEPAGRMRLGSVPTASFFSWRGVWDTDSISVAPPSPDFYPAGVLEAPWGWFGLSTFHHSSEVLEFTFIETSESAPQPLPFDLRIVQRAKEILADDTVWDREDDRVCQANDQKWSLYCALNKATTEVMGLPHHWQPAMNVVRFLLLDTYEDRTAGHVLMDVNNHQRTTLAELHEILTRAESQISDRLR